MIFMIINMHLIYMLWAYLYIYFFNILSFLFGIYIVESVQTIFDYIFSSVINVRTWEKKRVGKEIHICYQIISRISFSLKACYGLRYAKIISIIIYIWSVISMSWRNLYIHYVWPNMGSELLWVMYTSGRRQSRRGLPIWVRLVLSFWEWHWKVHEQRSFIAWLN